MNTILLKNSVLIVGAYLIPMIVTSAYDVSLIMSYAIFYPLLSYSIYVAAIGTKDKIPLAYQWLNDKNKPTDFIFKNLASFLKVSFVLFPLLYLLLFLLGYEQNNVNKDSLLEIIVRLSPVIWIYWLIVNIFFTYRLTSLKNTKGGTQCHNDV